MERFLVVLLACSALAKPPVSPAELQSQDGKIVGGNPAVIGQLPYQVSIQKATAYGPEHYCGGSIVAPQWILTAAHCAAGHVTSELTIAAGILNKNLSSGEPSMQLRSGLKNQIFFDYQTSSMMYDIALIKVTEPFEFNEFVQPIALPNQMQATPAGSVSTVSGWGSTRESGPLSQELLVVEVPTLSLKQCQDLYFPLWYDVDPSMICAGVADGGLDACQGDSGGPLVVNNQLVGIVSWGYGCARPNVPGVYTQVSYYSDWVKSLLV